MSYYNSSVEDTIRSMNSRAEGLSLNEVQSRLEKYGRNELKEKKKIPTWMLFLRQFKDFMILILIAEI
jgi:Ca2+-transporting ATPase